MHYFFVNDKYKKICHFVKKQVKVVSEVNITKIFITNNFNWIIFKIMLK